MAEVTTHAPGAFCWIELGDDRPERREGVLREALRLVLRGHPHGSRHDLHDLQTEGARRGRRLHARPEVPGRSPALDALHRVGGRRRVGPKAGELGGRSSPARSTSWSSAEWRSSRIRRARTSASGRRSRTRASASTTSRAHFSLGAAQHERHGEGRGVLHGALRLDGEDGHGRWHDVHGVDARREADRRDDGASCRRARCPPTGCRTSPSPIATRRRRWPRRSGRGRTCPRRASRAPAVSPSSADPQGAVFAIYRE